MPVSTALSARLSPPRSAPPDRGADHIARALRAPAPAASIPLRLDTAWRLPLSALPRRRAPAAAAILLHAALLTAALSVAFGVPAEPPPTVAVPLLFAPSPAPSPLPTVEPPVAAAPAATPAAPPVAAAPGPETALPDTPAAPLPAPVTTPPDPPAPPAAAATAPLATPLPPLAVPPAQIPPPARAAPARRRAIERPAPRPPTRRTPELLSTSRATSPLVAAPPAAAPPLAATAAPVGASAPLVPPRPVAGIAGNRPPAYPGPARQRGEEGTVIVRVQVTAEGAAAGVSLGRSSGHPALDAAALAAIRAWRFNPATRGGVAVAAEAEVPVAFRLDD